MFLYSSDIYVNIEKTSIRGHLSPIVMVLYYNINGNKWSARKHCRPLFSVAALEKLVHGWLL